MIHDEESIPIDAFCLNALIPVSSKRPTLQRANKENARTPYSDDPNDGGGDDVERAGSKEYAAVEVYYGDLEDGDQCKVGELVGDEYLTRLAHFRDASGRTHFPKD